MFKLRILYFYVFCLFMSSLVLASINSILSKFGGALRYICWFLIIPFLFFIFLIKCYAMTTTTTRGLCASRGVRQFLTFQRCLCVLCDLLFTLSCHFSAQKGTIFDKILMCLILSVYFYIFFFVSPPALIDFECVLIRVPLS